jgi:hypothetical protein
MQEQGVKYTGHLDGVYRADVFLKGRRLFLDARSMQYA